MRRYLTTVVIALATVATEVGAQRADVLSENVREYVSVAEPVVDTIRPVAYPELFPSEEPPRPIVVGRSMFMDTFDSSSAELVIARLRASSAFMSLAQFRIQGGAIGRVPVEATAYAHRKRRIMGFVAAMFQDPAQLPKHEAWVDDFAATLRGASASFA
jgi:hypothetical protein